MENSNSTNTKNALCYIPILAYIIYFVEQNKTEELLKHTRYWMIFLWAYIVLSIVLSWILSWLLFLVYLWLSGYFWYKTYNWEDVTIEVIDNFFEKK